MTLKEIAMDGISVDTGFGASKYGKTREPQLRVTARDTNVAHAMTHIAASLLFLMRAGGDGRLDRCVIGCESAVGTVWLEVVEGFHLDAGLAALEEAARQLRSDIDAGGRDFGDMRPEWQR